MSDLYQRYSAGSTIFRQGDDPGDMYMILEGSVELSRSDQGVDVALATLSASDFFGEMSVFDGGRRSATAKAAADVLLQRVTKEELQEKVSDPFVWSILTRMAGRIRAVDEVVEKSAVKDASRREAQSALSIRRSLYY